MSIGLRQPIRSLLAAVRRSGRARSLRAALLVAPAVAFLAIVFLVPIIGLHVPQPRQRRGALGAPAHERRARRLGPGRPTGRWRLLVAGARFASARRAGRGRLGAALELQPHRIAHPDLEDARAGSPRSSPKGLAPSFRPSTRDGDSATCGARCATRAARSPPSSCSPPLIYPVMPRARFTRARPIARSTARCSCAPSASARPSPPSASCSACRSPSISRRRPRSSRTSCWRSCSCRSGLPFSSGPRPGSSCSRARGW